MHNKNKHLFSYPHGLLVLTVDGKTIYEIDHKIYHGKKSHVINKVKTPEPIRFIIAGDACLLLLSYTKNFYVWEYGSKKVPCTYYCRKSIAYHDKSYSWEKAPRLRKITMLVAIQHACVHGNVFFLLHNNKISKCECCENPVNVYEFSIKEDVIDMYSSEKRTYFITKKHVYIYGYDIDRNFYYYNPTIIWSSKKENIIDIATGIKHTVFLTKSGKMIFDESNLYKPFLQSVTSKIDKRKRVKFWPAKVDKKIRAMKAGPCYTLFLTEKNKIIFCGCFGNPPNHDDVIINQTIPINLHFSSWPVEIVAVDNYFACLIRKEAKGDIYRCDRKIDMGLTFFKKILLDEKRVAEKSEKKERLQFIIDNCEKVCI